MTPRVYAVVAAAGRSRRMGTQKLLLPFGGTTVLGRVVKSLLAAPVSGVVVVVSAEGDDVAAEATRAGGGTTINPDGDGDMLSSIRCGLRALPPDCDAALVALGDQPTLRAAVVSEMVGVLSSRPDAIVVPACDGVRGHPLLVPSKWFDDVLARYDETGLRGLLSEHPDAVVELAVADGRILEDMDDPDAYQRAVRSLER